MQVSNLWRRLDISFVFVMAVFLSFSMSFYVYDPPLTAAVVGLELGFASYAIWRVSKIKPGQPLDR